MEGRASRPSSRAGTPGSPPNRGKEDIHLKQAIKLASIAVSMAALASLALCQETRVYREGSNWVQEMTGTWVRRRTSG